MIPCHCALSRPFLKRQVAFFFLEEASTIGRPVWSADPSAAGTDPVVRRRAGMAFLSRRPGSDRSEVERTGRTDGPYPAPGRTDRERDGANRWSGVLSGATVDLPGSEFGHQSQRAASTFAVVFLTPVSQTSYPLHIKSLRPCSPPCNPDLHVQISRAAAPGELNRRLR
jgi:hypothetical protein